MDKKIKVYTDGGARGNPGPAGLGVVIYDEKDNLMSRHNKYIGVATNNQAEYQALILALEKAKEMGAQNLECFLDSELVVKQLNGEYRVKDRDLGPLFIKVWNLKQGFKKITFCHIPREKNKEADRLVGEAVKNHK